MTTPMNIVIENKFWYEIHKHNVYHSLIKYPSCLYFRQLGMDLIPRVDGKQVDVEKCSIVKLYRVHQQSAYNARSLQVYCITYISAFFLAHLTKRSCDILSSIGVHRLSFVIC